MAYSQVPSCRQLDSKCGDLTRPLCSGCITSLHRSYWAVRPSVPLQYARLTVYAACASPLASKRLVPAVPHKSTDQSQAPYNAGRRLPSHQAPGRLVPGDGNAPGFDDKSLDYHASSKAHFRSPLLIHTCLRYVLNALTPILLNAALDRSILGWFGVHTWRPTPNGPPSSLVQL